MIFTDFMNSWLSDFIDNNSVATHGEIYSQFCDRFATSRVTKTALKKHMQAHFRVSLRSHFTFPPAHPLEVSYTHEECMHNHLHDLQIKKCVFVGEVAYDVDAKRTYVDDTKKLGRAAKAMEDGTQVKQLTKKPLPIATKISFLVACTQGQIMHHQHELLKKTSCNSFKKFLRALMLRMSDENLDGWNIVMDDVPDDVKQSIRQLVEPNGL